MADTLTNSSYKYQYAEGANVITFLSRLGRGFKGPLDPSSVFTTLLAAKEYIGAPLQTWYNGLVISIVSDGNNNGVYYILNGELIPIGQGSSSTTNIVNVKNFAKSLDYYLLSSSDSEPNYNAAWSTNSTLDVSEDKHYLWMYIGFFQTDTDDEPKIKTKPILIKEYATNEDGTEEYITHTHKVEYIVTDKNKTEEVATITTGWSEAITALSMSAENPYLWSKTTIDAGSTGENIKYRCEAIYASSGISGIAWENIDDTTGTLNPPFENETLKHEFFGDDDLSVNLVNILGLTTQSSTANPVAAKVYLEKYLNGTWTDVADTYNYLGTKIFSSGDKIRIRLKKNDNLWNAGIVKLGLGTDPTSTDVTLNKTDSTETEKIYEYTFESNVTQPFANYYIRTQESIDKTEGETTTTSTNNYVTFPSNDAAEVTKRTKTVLNNLANLPEGFGTETSSIVKVTQAEATPAVKKTYYGLQYIYLCVVKTDIDKVDSLKISDIIAGKKNETGTHTLSNTSEWHISNSGAYEGVAFIVVPNGKDINGDKIESLSEYFIEKFESYGNNMAPTECELKYVNKFTYNDQLYKVYASYDSSNSNYRRTSFNNLDIYFTTSATAETGVINSYEE